jgi:hypothetical protein
MAFIFNTVRYLLHTCGIVEDSSIKDVSRQRNFSRALRSYVEWGSENSKQRLAALKDKWAILEEPLEVLRGQDSLYIDPEHSPIISTSTSIDIASYFTNDNIIFSTRVMPGIRYIDVEATKSLSTDSTPEDEFILEGGQDLYVAAPIKYTGNVVNSQLIGNSYAIEKLTRRGITLIRCVYAPKGSPPIDSINENPLFIGPKYNKQVQLTKYGHSSNMESEQPMVRRVAPGRSGSVARRKGGANMGTCSPESYVFIEQLKELQEQDAHKLGGKRKYSQRRITKKKYSKSSRSSRRH